MKRIFALFLMMGLVVICFTGCGNKAILDPGNFSFTHVHMSDNVEGHCCEMDKWWDNESGIEVRLTDGSGIYLSEGTYQLFETKSACPYCN